MGPRDKLHGNPWDFPREPTVFRGLQIFSGGLTNTRQILWHLVEYRGVSCENNHPAGIFLMGIPAHFPWYSTGIPAGTITAITIGTPRFEYIPVVLAQFSCSSNLLRTPPRRSPRIHFPGPKAVSIPESGPWFTVGPRGLPEEFPA